MDPFRIIHRPEDAERDDLVRMVSGSRAIEFREDQLDDSVGLLVGRFAVFDEWTVIDSWWEGKFRERISKGAFKKTMRERRASIKVLYDHGYDPSLGNKPLGPIQELKEDDIGAYYEVPLIATDYNRDFMVPALRAGLLGASFRFQVIKDSWVFPEPDSGDLPERTIKEILLYEFGPVTFPAYEAASAGLRSRQEFEIWRSLDDQGRQELVRLIRQASGTPPGAATPVPVEPGSPHSQVSRAAIEQLARRLTILTKETP